VDWRLLICFTKWQLDKKYLSQSTQGKALINSWRLGAFA